MDLVITSTFHLNTNTNNPPLTTIPGTLSASSPHRAHTETERDYDTPIPDITHRVLLLSPSLQPYICITYIPLFFPSFSHSAVISVCVEIFSLSDSSTTNNSFHTSESSFSVHFYHDVSPMPPNDNNQPTNFCYHYPVGIL